MNLSSESQILVDGYIDEVKVNLPKKIRSDIAVEIHSLIMDTLEDVVEDGEVDEQIVLKVLKELGSPIEIAGEYNPHNYVIGPRLYAPFWMTIRWTFILMTFFYSLGIIFSWREATHSLTSFSQILGKLIGGYWNSTLQTFAIIFLVFIILERIIPEPDWINQLRAWGVISRIPFIRGIFGRTPTGDWESLVTIPKEARVKRGETIFEIVVIFLVLILFNFFPHKIGAYGFINNKPWYIPLLSPEFGTLLPFLNIFWLLTLVFNFTLLVTQQWTRTTRWIEIGLSTFSWILVYWIVSGPGILGLTPEYLALNSIGTDTIRLAEETLIPILSTILQVFLILHLILNGIKIVIKLFRLLGRPPIITFTSRKRTIE